MFTIYWRNLRATLRHKWFVFLEACRLGIPWLGLIHDWTKLTPGEFIPYTRYFYGAGRIRGGAHVVDDDPVFDAAWNHHQKANKHHWQYWVLIGPMEVTPLPMPDRYRREMLADWRGAGRGYDNGNPNTRDWYMTYRESIDLHPETRAWIEQELGVA